MVRLTLIGFNPVQLKNNQFMAVQINVVEAVILVMTYLQKYMFQLKKKDINAN